MSDKTYTEKIDISTSKYPNTFAIVDNSDFKELNKYKWHPNYIKNKPYVKRVEIIDGERVTYNMSRVVCCIQDEWLARKLVVDHINGNTLDNRASNLRVCTVSENNRNRIKVKGSSGFSVTPETAKCFFHSALLISSRGGVFS